MNSFELYSNIRKHIENRIDDLRQKDVVIFPYGQIGLLVKQVLNEQYGIQEKYIIDNGLSKYNANILSFENLKTIMNKDIIIILTAANYWTYLETKKELVNEFDMSQLMCIIEPVVVERSEEKAYYSILRDLMKVRKVNSDKKLIRMGRNNDGGYVMLNDFDDCKVAYSFGISDDVSWDRDMSLRKVDVFQYDPTIKCAPEKNEFFHFYGFGISGIDDEKRKMLTLSSFLKNNNHENLNNMILKMDVEGAEWEAIMSTPEERLQQFDQLVFELHGMTAINKRDIILSTLEKLNRTHQLIWVHGNNYSVAGKAGDILIPDVIEVLYLSKKKYCFASGNCVFPCDLDQSNNKRVLDFELGNWGE